MSVRTCYEGHYGTLDIESNHVVFYGMYFDNMVEAVEMLRHMGPPPTDQGMYTPWYRKGHRGVENELMGTVFYFSDRVWLAEADAAARADR